ncbi:hypothetical protein HPB48_005985 [Haemaphysalis longicornis]|uniref:Uncharacterized protein n=1 Tax=Haemaphysalis longicornis TaxID=44386 RepID=A0A9J6FK73_HAELO|nr:hypothetical protein HPB48_005985 [Haemaphysalis longicornis]
MDSDATVLRPPLLFLSTLISGADLATRKRYDRQPENHLVVAASQPKQLQHVLPPVANSRAAYSEAHEPGPGSESRDVHGSLSDGVLPRAQALHHLQPGVHRCRVPHLLQRYGELHLFTLRQLQLGHLRAGDVAARPTCLSPPSALPGLPLVVDNYHSSDLKSVPRTRGTACRAAPKIHKRLGARCATVVSVGTLS